MKKGAGPEGGHIAKFQGGGNECMVHGTKINEKLKK